MDCHAVLRVRSTLHVCRSGDPGEWRYFASRRRTRKAKSTMVTDHLSAIPSLATWHGLAAFHHCAVPPTFPRRNLLTNLPITRRSHSTQSLCHLSRRTSLWSLCRCRQRASSLHLPACCCRRGRLQAPAACSLPPSRKPLTCRKTSPAARALRPEIRETVLRPL